MTSLSRKFKDIIVNLVKGTIIENPFYNLKLKYDLFVMNKAGKNYTYDKQTSIIIEMLHKDSNCIDIGCHKGDILKEMIKYSPNGKHFAFEPIDELYADLKKNFKGVELYKVALSSAKGNTIFYNVVTGQGVSGLKQREYDREHKTIEINVEIDLLDNIIPDGIKIDFIKIDIEGGEYDAMMGGEKLIKKYKPIMVFEFEKGAADKYGTTPEKMYDFLVVKMQMKLGLLEYWIKGKRDFCFNRTEFTNQYETGENFYFIAY